MKKQTPFATRKDDDLWSKNTSLAGGLGSGTGTGSKIIYFICPMWEWRMREHAIPIVHWYQVALIYLNNRKQREQQRRKLSSICGAYLIVYNLDFKKFNRKCD